MSDMCASHFKWVSRSRLIIHWGNMARHQRWGEINEPGVWHATCWSSASILFSNWAVPRRDRSSRSKKRWFCRFCWQRWVQHQHKRTASNWHRRPCLLEILWSHSVYQAEMSIQFDLLWLLLDLWIHRRDETMRATQKLALQGYTFFQRLVTLWM